MKRDSSKSAAPAQPRTAVRTPRVSMGTGWITPAVTTHLKKTVRAVRVSTGTGWITPAVTTHLKKTLKSTGKR